MRRASTSVALATCLLASAAAPATAATAEDFGSVAVGDSVTRDVELSLTAALSELPSDAVLYGGGQPAVDLVLQQVGLTAPVTAGSLYGVTGEVTATYHVSLTPAPATDFSVDDAECLTGAGTCEAEITFTPAETGPRSALAEATISDVDLTGGGSLGSLVDALAPFLAASVEESLDVELTGTGTDGTSGGITLEVDVEEPPVPCLLVSASLLDFGTLAFSTPDQVSAATRNVTVTNCSTGDGAVMAQGTDATGDGDPAAAWTLSAAGGNPCSAIDTYGIRLSGDEGPPELQLSTSASPWQTLEVEGVAPTTVTYEMPCEGSAGAGQTMTSQITFLATVP